MVSFNAVKRLKGSACLIAVLANIWNLVRVHVCFIYLTVYNFVNWSADEQAGGPKQWFCLDNAAEARAILSKHANAAPVVITGHRHIGLNYKELDEKITLLPFIIF